MAFSDFEFKSEHSTESGLAIIYGEEFYFGLTAELYLKQESD